MEFIPKINSDCQYVYLYTRLRNDQDVNCMYFESVIYDLVNDIVTYTYHKCLWSIYVKHLNVFFSNELYTF